MKEAKNFQYLINPEKFENRAAMLEALARTNYDVILVDAFYNVEPLMRDEVALLRRKPNGGCRLVIACIFTNFSNIRHFEYYKDINIGAAESFRYYWQKDWKLHSPRFLKKEYGGYQDEMWVKYWCQEWKDIILYSPRSYCNIIMEAGFDGIYLDNVEAYYSIYFD